ncbi:hypothetical protein INT46_008253 [Mucor plumbeus]|uniref:Tc1-like transposase DDE domain-containing protein n=1 Tax=Mucor plumbeus TaxID=97098 RepID=A0A8H7UUC6_9FUNG|nr:hypothetical protein INT46_008253 [Mucor plumbeus]
MSLVENPSKTAITDFVNLDIHYSETITEDIIKELCADIATEELETCLLICTLITPYVPSKQNWYSISHQLPFVLMANEILHASGYNKFAIIVCPLTIPEKLNALSIDAPSLFSLFCSPKLKKGVTKCRSYTPIQIQELLKLVIEQGMSARKAGLTVGIVIRTAQHYAKLYEDDVEKRFPGTKKLSSQGGNDRKLEGKHTNFLCNFYEQNATAVLLWEARYALLSAFPDLISITLTDKVLAARATDNTLQLRKEIVLVWKSDQAINWQNNCIFIDEAGFNMHIRRNFGRSKIGTRSDHFLQFVSNAMNILDARGMTGRYLVMDNATIHRRPDIRKLIVDQGYKVAHHPPYSPFLNPIELFCAKVTAGIKREIF